MQADKKKLWALGVTVFILLLAAYANHFNNGFHFDDAHAVVDNVHIRELKNIPSFFTDPKMFSNDPQHWGMRPLVTTTLAIDYWLAGGLTPFWFQLDTFVWFVVLCAMLYAMYQKLLRQAIQPPGATYIALIATAWYALHTANAETLNYIISRSDVLSTFCIVASFLIYISFPGKRKWFLYAPPAVIGVFAKETVLVLIILLFFYNILFEYQLSLTGMFKRSNFKSVIKAVGSIIPILMVVAVVQVYTLWKTPGIPGISNPACYYILTQSYVWLHYFGNFFLPINLSADTDWTVISKVWDLRIMAGLVFVACLIITIFKTSKNPNTRPIAFGLIWFAAALLPTSLAPFAEVTNDHRMFFPFIGLAFSVVTTLGLWLNKYPQVFIKYRSLITVGVTVVLLLNAYGVYQRNKVWRTEESLWLDVTQKSPQNGRGLMNYGLTQMQKANYKTADSCFEKARAYLPLYSTLYINIGVLKGATNQPQEAEINFKKAIALAPNTYEPYLFYARYLTQNSRFTEAQPLIERALALNPYSAMAFKVAMDVYNNVGLWDKLQQTATKALATNPKDTLAIAYARAAKNQVPYTAVPNAQTIGSGPYYLNLSLFYYNQNQYPQCIEACRQALKINPAYADAYNNMGAAYNQMQQWDKAIIACKKALEINPQNKLAAGNLKWAQSRVKDN
jgi:tetratricopeptide (TPR) repeat protein